MKQKTEFDWAWFILAIAIILSLILMITKPAKAEGWSASQTITMEPDATIYTACIEYDFTDWLAVNFTLDYHSLYLAAYDLSTTVYVPFNDHIYSTVGIRKPGKEHPEERGLIPYLSVTYRF